eukprot:g35837.t1
MITSPPQANVPVRRDMYCNRISNQRLMGEEESMAVIVASDVMPESMITSPPQAGKRSCPKGHVLQPYIQPTAYGGGGEYGCDSCLRCDGPDELVYEASGVPFMTAAQAANASTDFKALGSVCKIISVNDTSTGLVNTSDNAADFITSDPDNTSDFNTSEPGITSSSTRRRLSRRRSSSSRSSHGSYYGYSSRPRSHNNTDDQKSTNCSDTYQFTFIRLDANTTFEYLSEDFELTRSNAASVPQHPWKWGKRERGGGGGGVKSWAPSSENVVLSWYTCPNEDCVKLQDPATEIETIRLLTMIFVGSGVLGVVWAPGQQHGGQFEGDGQHDKLYPPFHTELKLCQQFDKFDGSKYYGDLPSCDDARGGIWRRYVYGELWRHYVHKATRHRARCPVGPLVISMRLLHPNLPGCLSVLYATITGMMATFARQTNSEALCYDHGHDGYLCPPNQL